jgi:biopolymer transport protein ExbD
MAVANHLVATPAADQPDATVVAVTADGKVFLGVQAVEINSLSGALTGADKGTVYLKVDAKAPYQKILTVLDALRGRSIVLIAAPASRPSEAKPMPPYGIKVTVNAE